MPHSIKGLHSNPLAPSELRRALTALPRTFQELLGDGAITAYYGWRCNLHADLQYVPMRIAIRGLERFIDDSLGQQIVVLGGSDFVFVVPENRLEILFCHEGDIHLAGRDPALVEGLRASAVFSAILFRANI